MVRRMANYEEKLGQWVTLRCEKRHNKEGMDSDVVQWLKTGRNGTDPPNEDTAPTAKVLGWLVSTIVEPDWPTI